MVAEQNYNEYKVSLRVKEEALQTFHLFHPATILEYGFFLRNSLATDKFVIFQCARTLNKLFIAKSDDVSFITVEQVAAESGTSETVEPSGVKSGPRRKSVQPK